MGGGAFDGTKSRAFLYIASVIQTSARYSVAVDLGVVRRSPRSPPVKYGQVPGSLLHVRVPCVPGGGWSSQ